MNIGLIICRTFVAFNLLCSCASIRHVVPTEESVERISTFWTFAKNKDSTVVIREKAWYKDSIGITEIVGFFEESTNNVSTTGIRTFGYRFVDLRKKWIYEYETFTDTATITNKFSYSDSTMIPGGWKFVNKKPTIITGYTELPDTTIGETTYRNTRIYTQYNQINFEQIALFRCDKKGSYFQLDDSMSKRVGCPVAFLRTYPLGKPEQKFDLEIKYISNVFPDSVVRVFSAWKKNEMLYPIH